MRTPRWMLLTVATAGAAAGAIWLSAPTPRGTSSTPADAPTSSVSIAEEVSSVDDAARLNEGWAVVDSRDHTIHITDSSGAVVRSFGRRGGGPGEFVNPALIAVTPTRIYVAQRARPELSEFDHAGRFVRLISVAAPCGAGALLVMDAGTAGVFGVRRCIEPPQRVRFQLERLVDGTMRPWGPADTILLVPNRGVPISFPLLAVDDRRVFFGDGNEGCLREIDVATEQTSARRCFVHLPRHPIPDSARAAAAARWGDRVALPDSLPRLRRIAIVGSMIAGFVVEDLIRATWRRLDAVSSVPSSDTLGRPAIANSFLAGGTQLIVTDDEDGIRLEVVRVRR